MDSSSGHHESQLSGSDPVQTKTNKTLRRVFLQEPSPAKMAATDPSLPSSESDAESGCGRWQEDQRGKGAGVTPMWTVTDVDPPGPEQNPAGAAEHKTHTHTHV